MLYADGLLKIADFGLAKELGRPGQIVQHTNYVSTRWYRAPEIILRSGIYDGKVDIFALGCIMAELHTGVPLLPGTSEDDMLHKLCNLIGQPPASILSRNRSLFSSNKILS